MPVVGGGSIEADNGISKFQGLPVAVLLRLIPGFGRVLMPATATQPTCFWAVHQADPMQFAYILLWSV
jgi:hypothetical protein